MGEISKELEKFTCKNANFDTERGYISISHCSLSVSEILNQWHSGFTDTPEIRLRCYKGYQMERDLKQRMKSVYAELFNDNPIELTAFDGLIKGHPDFTFDGYPGDFKTVQIDDHLPIDRLPKKVYWQMQGYMLYHKSNKSLVIYESRGSGKIMDFWVYANVKIQDQIHEKFSEVVRTIRNNG